MQKFSEKSENFCFNELFLFAKTSCASPSGNVAHTLQNLLGTPAHFYGLQIFCSLQNRA
jgi:hypothetical protein